MAKDDLIGMGGGLRLDPTKFPQVKCDKCGHNVFRQASIIYNVSGLSIGAGAEDFPYPVPVYVCDKCGTILKTVREELEKIEADKEKNPTDTKSSTLIL